MLAQLRRALIRHGYLNHKLVKESADLPDPASYAYHFGSLGRAYALVGYVPEGRQATMIKRKTRWATPDEADILAGQADARFSDGHVSRSRDEILITNLKALLEEKGKLTRAIIDAAPNLPCAVTLIARMGSIGRIYSAAGFTPGTQQASTLARKRS
jgi:hypothetical protein